MLQFKGLQRVGQDWTELKRLRKLLTQTSEVGRESAPASLLQYVIYLQRLLIRERKCLRTQSATGPLTHNIHFEITLAQGSHPGP